MELVGEPVGEIPIGPEQPPHGVIFGERTVVVTFLWLREALAFDARVCRVLVQERIEHERSELPGVLLANQTDCPGQKGEVVHEDHDGVEIWQYVGVSEAVEDIITSRC